jgi:hypothetical protein
MSYALNKAKRHHGLATRDATVSHQFSTRPGFTPIKSGPLRQVSS